MIEITRSKAGLAGLLALVVCGLAVVPAAAQASPSGIVISQIYPGGTPPEQRDAIYDRKFVELFNGGSEPVNVSNWSVGHSNGFTAPTAADTDQIPAGTTMPAGGYLLISGAPAGPCKCNLPTPADVLGTAENPETVDHGAVTLRDASGVIQDEIGWWEPAADPLEPASISEGNPVKWPTYDHGELALYRADGGCQDTNENEADAEFGAPIPRNSASPLNPCPKKSPAFGSIQEVEPGRLCIQLSTLVCIGAPASESRPAASSEPESEPPLEPNAQSARGSESGADPESAPASEEAEARPVAAATDEVAAAASPAAEPLLEAGFSNGLEGWSTAGAGEAVPTVVASPLQSGSTHSAKVVLSGSQNRSELIFGGNGTASTAGIQQFGEGAEYWYGFSFYIQQMVYGNPGAQNLIMQFKSEGEGGPNFGLQLWNYEGKKGIWSAGEAMDGDRFLAPAPEQQWNAVAIHFRASSTGTGFYEIFLNGKLIDSRKNVSMIVPGHSSAYIKNGLYRNGAEIPGTSELFLGSARLGTSQASVQPEEELQTAVPAAKVTVSLSPTSIPATGTSTSTATASLTDADGNPVTTANSVAFTSNASEEKIGAVTDTS